MTDRELMQQALDALEWCYDVTEWPANGNSPQDKAVEALRARLSQCARCGEVNPAEIHTCTPKQPEQEPVGWIYEDDEGRIMFSQTEQYPPLWEPVYKARNA